ncbi:MAG: flagellar hook-associated protein FlgK [Algicola sp.]|nr:flagellar hook-associated protein FlgK [Algicola sp.]
MADMLSIGTSGIQASNLLLQTTGHNIANVNTPGFVRERVELGASQYGGIGRQDVERVVSEFAQRQVRRDTANHSFYEQFVNEATRVDTLFAGTSNSIATSMDGFFQRLQSASDDPSSIAARQLVISEAEELLGTFQTLNGLVLDQGTTINEQLDIFANETNNLIQNIAKLNRNINSIGLANANQNPNALLSERDESLRKLSELIEINTLDGANGEKLVFLNTGQSLILKEGDFNLLAMSGDPDPQRKDLRLSLSTNSTLTVPVEASKVGGKIGGLLSFRKDVLEPTQNRLGQIALSLADAFNQQNRLGMDADGQLGSDLFALPQAIGASAYAANTGTSSITARLEPGKGSELSSNNFLFEYNGAAITMTAIDDEGNLMTDPLAIKTLPGPFPATYNSANAPGNTLFGLEITFGAGLVAGDKFLLKPTANASSEVLLLSHRPEDIALASPIRTEGNLTNVGGAIISEGVVTDTDPATSDFTAANTLNIDPLYVKYIGGNQFELHSVNPLPLPSAGVALATTPVGAFPNNQYDNIMTAAGAPVSTYGYNFNIVGTPATNDVFTIKFNTSGFNDNRNGLKLAGLQGDELLRKNVVSTAAADNTLTFHEAYARIVSQVGEKTANASTNEVAFDALLDQSSAWHESISGVNLDEEAANLVRFQQAYSAAAKIISVAQATFETLLSAVR